MIMIIIRILSLRFSGDHKQMFYWGHKEILVPGESASSADAMFLFLFSFYGLLSAWNKEISLIRYRYRPFMAF